MSFSEDTIRKEIITYFTEESIELYDMKILDFPSPTKVEVYVYSSDGVNHELIERLSFQIQSILQDFNIKKGSYDLLVSSPGLNRILKTNRHFELAIGEFIKVKTITEVCGIFSFQGILNSIEDGYLDITTEDNHNIKLHTSNIKSSKTKHIEKV